MSKNDYDLSKITKIKNDLKEALNITKDDGASNLKEKEFYRDLDRKKRGKGCSLSLIVVLLIIIFSSLIYLLFFIKNYTKSGIDYIALKNNAEQTNIREDFIDRTKDLDAGNSLLLEYSVVEVSSYLGVYDDDFPLKRPKINIDDRGIKVSGKTSENWFSLPVSTVVRPKIENNKLTFVLDDLASGSITLPTAVRKSVSDYLVRLMKTRELYDSNLEVVSAYTVIDKLVIEVSKKD